MPVYHEAHHRLSLRVQRTLGVHFAPAIRRAVSLGGVRECSRGEALLLCTDGLASLSMPGIIARHIRGAYTHSLPACRHYQHNDHLGLSRSGLEPAAESFMRIVRIMNRI